MFALLGKLPAGLRQAAIYGSAIVTAKVVSLLMVPIFTHYLAPADYGRLDVLQTLANLLSIVIGFGMTDTLFRFAGPPEDEDERRQIAANVFGTALVICVAALALTQTCAPLIAEFLPGGISVYQTRLILGSLAVTGAISVPMSWLRMRDRAFAFFLGSAGLAAIQAMLSATMLWLGFGIDGVLLAGLVCAIGLALALSIHQLRETGVRFDRSTQFRHAHFGMVLVLAGIAAFVMDSFDRWILAAAAGPAEMAMYALAAKIGMMAAFMVQPFEMWWLPRRFAVLAESGGAAKCARSTEIGLVVCILAAIGVATVGPLVVRWMTPAAYHGAIAYVPWLAALATLNAATNLVNTACLNTQRTLWPLAIDGSAAALALIGYGVLIPGFGAWGAIFATAAALGVRFAAYVMVGRRLLPIPYAFARLAAPAFVGLAMMGWQASVTDPVSSMVIGAAAGLSVLTIAIYLNLLPLGKAVKEALMRRRAAV